MTWDFIQRWFGPDRDHAHIGRRFTDRLLIRRFWTGVVAIALAIGGILLIADTDWKQVLAGALLAWGVALMVWAVESYRHRREVVSDDLRHMAELDLLHARLNQIAAKVGARPLGLQAEIEHVTAARQARLAHFTGLDEFRSPHVPSDGYEFWDSEALGGEL